MRRLSLLWLFAVASCGPSPCDTGKPGTICEVAGTGNLGFNADGLPAAQTDLYLVSEVRRGPDGRIYLMDFNNHRLRVIDAAGKVQTIAGNGFHQVATVGVAATDSGLENPIDFDFLPDGRVVFVSYHDPRVLRIDGDGTIQVIAGDGGQGLNGNEGDGGDALQAEFIQLAGIAVAPNGAIYVSDTMANRVRVIYPGGLISTWAGNGQAAYSGDGGPANQASINWPTGMSVDAAGDLFFSDAKNNVIRRVAPDGTISTVAGTGDAGAGGDGGPATAAQLNQPDGVAVAADGTLYVSDRSNFRVRRVDPGGTIETLAGLGTQGRSGDDGPALKAQLGYTARLSLDGNRLLVADQSNSCARAIVLGPAQGTAQVP